MTHPDVFIIESLDPDDEGNGRFEGSNISHVLRLHGKNPKYNYVRTPAQFKQAVTEFGHSEYRYLHISSHGNRDGMSTTNDEIIKYKELAKFLEPVLEKKRLFLSACSMVTENMASEIIPKTRCNSVIGPTDDIEFAVAAVFWPALYHLIFSENEKTITRKILKTHLNKLTSLFGIEFGYFARSTSKKQGYSKVL